MVKLGEDRSITALGDTSSETEPRTIVCRNCKRTWEDERTPESYSECPVCGESNNPAIRRILFYLGVTGRSEF